MPPHFASHGIILVVGSFTNLVVPYSHGVLQHQLGKSSPLVARPFLAVVCLMRPVIQLQVVIVADLLHCAALRVGGGEDVCDVIFNTLQVDFTSISGPILQV